MRTLLVVVTLAAVGSWAYWIAWPRWKLYREEFEFESKIVKFHAGISEREANGLEPLPPKGVILLGSTWYDKAEVEIAKPPRADFRIDDGADDGDSGYRFCTAYGWPNGTYVIWWRFARSKSNDWKPSCTEFAAYWLPIPPVNYRPATSRAEKELRKLGGEITPEIWARFANVYDLIEMTALGHSIAPGFKYALLYSDPPAKPMQ